MEVSDVNERRGTAVDSYDINERFMSLDELVDASFASCGVLASYIERFGVDGWDRYGRYKSFLPGANEKEVSAALDFVAECMSRYMRLGGKWREDDSWPYWENRRFGWRFKDIPDFSAAVPGAATPEPIPRFSPKEENNLLRLVGVLVKLLVTKGDPLPAGKGRKLFSSQEELIGTIEELFERAPGLSRRHLQNVFARANVEHNQ